MEKRGGLRNSERLLNLASWSDGAASSSPREVTQLPRGSRLKSLSSPPLSARVGQVTPQLVVRTRSCAALWQVPLYQQVQNLLRLNYSAKPTSRRGGPTSG